MAHEYRFEGKQRTAAFGPYSDVSPASARITEQVDVVAGDSDGAGMKIDSGGGAIMRGGGTKDDSLTGIAGDDEIGGGDGADYLSGGDGYDTISGGAGNDIIEGQAGYNLIEGGDGDDWISGGAGDDTINAGSGNDTVLGEHGGDLIEGEQNPNLAANLIAAEGPEILRWAIDGARKFLADGGGVKGLRIPQSVTDATRVYFEEEDIVLQFLMEAQRNVQDRNEWAPGAFLSNKALLEKFNYWADCNGYNAKWSVHSLTKAIRESAWRYGLSERRGNKARGFQVERRLVDRPTWVGEDGAGRRAAIQHLRMVENQAETGDGKGDEKAAKEAKSD
ncbi:hypothetical protein [Pseudorhodobacter sp.]|uniref:hypothetical protein n=1 Tax=Pseudorhodobacter sp. TaxID=1934400 RepID=UPI0026480340|nr:hypothetical protein [Pseudorhodobacter sp.]MDN5786640.1 hypothetical protein [Pseudorhodobacter sp.]